MASFYLPYLCGGQNMLAVAWSAEDFLCWMLSWQRHCYHYKGEGRTSRGRAGPRATHAGMLPISACYFEKELQTFSWCLGFVRIAKQLLTAQACSLAYVVLSN